MSTIKIILEPNEDEEVVNDSLIKALSDASFEKLSNKRWADPLMNTLSDKFDQIYADTITKMMGDILDTLKE